MIHQCVGCGSVLPRERRSPRCERCWIDYQRQRNRAKVWAYRERARLARASSPTPEETRLPNEEELSWLQWLNLGLAEPIRRIVELVGSGRPESDPEVAQLAMGVLQRYDSLRRDFEERVRLRPDPTDLAASWRGFFESIRNVVS